MRTKGQTPAWNYNEKITERFKNVFDVSYKKAKNVTNDFKVEVWQSKEHFKKNWWGRYVFLPEVTNDISGRTEKFKLPSQEGQPGYDKILNELK